MNKNLIAFIDLCLIDGAISKKMGIIINSLSAVFSQLEETNTFLSSISESAFDASSSLYDLSYESSRLP